MQASFEEKSIWIQFASMVAAMGAYFVLAWQMIQAGMDRLVGFVPLFGATVMFLVVVQILGHAAAAIWCRPEPRDERDRLIGCAPQATPHGSSRPGWSWRSAP